VLYTLLFSDTTAVVDDQAVQWSLCLLLIIVIKHWTCFYEASSYDKYVDNLL